tara:strand:- start:2488 stop:2715 length:228 start_codon:yes stop_codon:yes gene_type:complete
MTQLGEEIDPTELGKGGNKKFVWVQCPTCLEERWAVKKPAAHPSGNTQRLCRPCTTKNASRFFISAKSAEGFSRK